MLVYVLDVSADPERDFLTVRGELAAFDPMLSARPALIALNKIDLVGAERAEETARAIASLAAEHAIDSVFVISAEQRIGLEPLVAAIARLLGAGRGRGAMSQVSYKEEHVARARRVVVKVGSAVLSDVDGLRPEVIEQLAARDRRGRARGTRSRGRDLGRDRGRARAAGQNSAARASRRARRPRPPGRSS